MKKADLVNKIMQVSENNTPADRKLMMGQPVVVLQNLLALAQAAQGQSKRASLPKAKAQPKRKSKAKSKAKAKAQPKRQSKAKAQPKRKSAPKRQSAPKATRKSAGKLPKTLKARAAKISAAIKAGKIAQKQGKSKPSDYADSLTTRQKYDKFVALYAGTVIRKASRKSKDKGPSIVSIYESLRSTHRRPYFLSAGYSVKGFSVGGGKKGAGVIRAVPGKGAKPFKSLPEGQQRAVLAFLNSAEGQKLRGKGAPKLVSGSPARYW